MEEHADRWDAHASTTLDIRPDVERGGEPFVRIMKAAERIEPGHTLVIIAPFEPIPLYGVLGARGFSYETRKVALNEWVVHFTRHHVI